MEDQARRLEVGVRYLRSCRQGSGRWRIFPFWYTLSALVEIAKSIAAPELRYAAPVLERSRRAEGQPPSGLRRKGIARRALEMT